MIAGGCGIPCSSDVPGFLLPLLDKISGAIPGSDRYYVPYNGSMLQGKVSTVLMIKAVNEFTAKCPKTPIIFLGYSLGGVVVMNTVCGGVPATTNVIAAITYGEETYVGGLPWDKGPCSANAVRFAPYSVRLVLSLLERLTNVTAPHSAQRYGRLYPPFVGRLQLLPFRR